jgi:hypothetical protein
MNSLTQRIGFLAGFVAVVWATPALAQRWREPPQIGYAYPAGGQQGQTLQITIGGQRFHQKTEVFVSGDGIEASLFEYLPPLRNKEINKIREVLKQAQNQFREANKKRKDKVSLRSREGRMQLKKLVAKIAKEKEVEVRDIMRFREWRKRRNDPKRQLNPQLAETLTAEVKIDPDATPGVRTIRIVTPRGISNPIRFLVGQLAQVDEIEPNHLPGSAMKVDNLPVVINGQIMPGDVDHFRFTGKKGQQIVLNVDARKIVPYLADAVPGWFQAVVAICDAEGEELAFADDFRFEPDPILHYTLPSDGEYIVKIRDSIYRGREDFVYRIRLGQLPQITGVYPLAVPVGQPSTIHVSGYNIPKGQQVQKPRPSQEGLLPVRVQKGTFAAEPRNVLVVDTPVLSENEPNDPASQAMKLKGDATVNGRIDQPGDVDVYSIIAGKGETIIARVQARTLGSPLDSLLWITDAAGKELARNDDYEDPGEGLVTHHADARLELQAPADGTYLVWIGDTQHRGGKEFAYALQVGGSAGDFDLRVTPSAMNLRAGQTAPIEVFALRKAGFDGPIDLQLVDAPKGFTLSGGRIPAGVDKIRLTLHVPPQTDNAVLRLNLVGEAKLGPRNIRRQAQAADDTMQAFIYHHLVCADQWTVKVDKRRFPGPRWDVKTQLPLTLQPGQKVVLKVEADRPANERDKINIRLDQGPEGVRLVGRKIDGKNIELTLRADKNAKASLAGNLIFEVLATRTFRAGKPNQRTRTIPLGTMPAIPFRIAEE